MQDLTHLTNDFLRYLKVQQGRNALTVANYRHYLNRFINWLKQTAEVSSHAAITAETISSFKRWLAKSPSPDHRPLSPASQNYHLIALRALFRYLQSKNYSALAPAAITLNHTQARQSVELDDQELKRLLDAPHTSSDELIIQLRDAALLGSLAATGLKVSQIVALKQSDYNPTNGHLTARRGKESRDFELPQTAHHALHDYLAQRRDNEPALFIRHDRAAKRAPRANTLTPRSIQRVLERYRKACGISKRVTPHSLRRAFAQAAQAKGVNLKTLQAKLGHKNLITTKLYQTKTGSTH